MESVPGHIANDVAKNKNLSGLQTQNPFHFHLFVLRFAKLH